MTKSKIQSCRKFGLKANEKKLYDPVQLRSGIMIEFEHLNKSDPQRIEKATCIAKHHLAEFPDYYSRLNITERKDFWDKLCK